MCKPDFISYSLIGFFIFIAAMAGLGVTIKPTPVEWAQIAPYSGIVWEGDKVNPNVLVEGEWFELEALDDVPMSKIQEFAEAEYGDQAMAQMRIAEDLYDVLAAMGTIDPSSVSMTLRNLKTNEVFEKHDVVMTSENRRAVYTFNRVNISGMELK